MQEHSKNNRKAMKRSLTNVVRLVVLNNFCQFHVTGDDSHLIGGLVGKVQGFSLTAPEEELARTGVLSIDSAHVEGGVARGVAPIHVGSVEQKVV